MNPFTHLLRASLLTAVTALSVHTSALAQRGANYPNKPIQMIVPYPPGGGTDVVARIIQGRLQDILGQPVVIDNRGGAAGLIGTEVAARAAPDGYTVLFTLSSHTINPSFYPNLGFDTARDFAAVAMVASLPQILVANLQLEAKSVAELVALAKAKPGALFFASPGTGSPGHLAGELFKLRTGTMMTHVPYRGGGPAVADTLGGQVPLLWVSIPAAAQFVKSGRLKALAVSTVKRSAFFPDVPTVQEAGVADFEVDSWYAMFVPNGTPQPVIAKLNQAINTVLAEPEIREKLLAQGGEAVGGSPEALQTIVAAELARWPQLVRQAGLKIDGS